MAERLDGTVALITGASSGIGAATARALAAQGATVALAARRVERLETLATELRGQGGKTLILETDITDEAQARGAVDRTVSELGRLDTLVNNAGQMLLGPAIDAPLEEWERMVALNVRGLLYTTHAALPHLIRAATDSPRKVADLVNISSVAGRFPRSGSSVYNLTKFGVTGFSEALRQELAAQHVRVTVIEPGAVTSELRTHIRPGIREQTEQRFANIEILEAEDVADLIAYIVTRSRRVGIAEVVLRGTEQV